MYGKISRLAFLFIFCLVGIQQSYAQLGAIIEVKGRLNDAKTVLAKSQEYLNKFDDNKWARAVTQGEKVKLPCSLPFDKNLKVNEDPNSKYQLILDDVRITPTGTRATVLLRISKSIFKSGETGFIFFAAESEFTKNGGFVGETNLYLLQDFEIDLSSKIKLKIKAIDSETEEITNVAFNCEGFVNLHLSADLKISNELAIKEFPDGKTTRYDKETEKTITGEGLIVPIVTDITDLNEWLFEIKNIPKFQFKKIPDFTWSVDRIVFDNSSSAKPADPSFKENEAWRGFYFKNAEMIMPKYINEEGATSNVRKSVKASLLIDDQGRFLGEVKAKNFIEKGKMGAWEFTVADLTVEFGNSGDNPQLQMKGEVKNIPLAVDGKLAYEAQFVDAQNGGSELRFNLDNIDADKVIDPSVLGAAGVSIESFGLGVSISNDEIHGEMNFNGVSVSAGLKEKGAASSTSGDKKTLFKFTVQKLKIKSRRPYFEVSEDATFDEGVSELYNLPIKVNGPIKVKATDERITFNANVGIDLMKETISGTTDIDLSVVNDGGSWKYGGANINEICLKLTGTNSYTISGCIRKFENNPDYGSGFEGKVNAVFVDKFEIEASAMFGRKNMADPTSGTPDLVQYWYVDGSLTFAAPIPIFTGIGMNKFIGGARYNMDSGVEVCTGGLGCNTNTGKKYEVKEGNLGISAGLGIVSMPSDKVFSGELVLSIDFVKGKNDKWSLGSVGLDGNVAVLSSPSDENKSEAEDDCKNVFKLKWQTKYIVDTKTLSGVFDAHINYLNILKGTYDGSTKCQAGRTSIFYSPTQWYLRAGIPSNPNKVTLFIGETNLGDVTNYFYMGTVAPNPLVAAMPAGMPGSVTPLDPSLLNLGMAFGLGLRFKADFKDKIELKPKFTLGKRIKIGFDCGVNMDVTTTFGAGFDLVLVKINDADCPKGLDGWYANGQAFLYAGFTIGGYADCYGLSSGTVKVLGVKIAAMVAAQAPNPTYIQGAARGEVDVLGFVKAGFDVSFKYGNQCTPREERSAEYYTVIENIQPKNKYDEIGPYDAIKVTLKKRIGEPIPLRSGNITPQSISISSLKYKIRVGDKDIEPSINLFSTDNYKLTMDANGNEYSFVSLRALPAGSYEGVVTVTYDGIAPETRTFNFKVREEEKMIPITNISYSYPMPKMDNFYLSTGKKGYIKLTKIPGAPIKRNPEQEFAIKIYKSDKLISSEKVLFNENNWATNQVEFSIPSASKMNKNTTYTLKLVKTRDFNLANLANKETGFSSSTTETDNKDVEVLTYDFKTSRYNTFEEKMAAISFGSPSKVDNYSFSLPLVSSSTSPTFKTLDPEFFEPMELTNYTGGNVSVAPLIRVSLDPATNIEPNVHNVVNYSTIPSEMKLEISDNGYRIDFLAANKMANQLAQGNVGKNSITLVSEGNKFLKVGYYLPGKLVPESVVTLPYLSPKITY